MKTNIALTLIPASLAIGVFLGYRAAIDNQFYDDAPAKIVLFSAALEKGKANEYLCGQITRQVRILNEPEMTKHRNSLLLRLPPHGIKFIGAYEQYAPVIQENIQYQQAIKMLCGYNQRYTDTCE